MNLPIKPWFMIYFQFRMIFTSEEKKKNNFQKSIVTSLNFFTQIQRYDTTTSGGESKLKEVILSEADPLWPTLRHMHIADTIEWILKMFEEFVRENKATKLYTGAKKVNSLAEMSEAMKAMPQYQEMLGKYSLHINMANQCMKVFNQKNLTKIAGLEQVLFFFFQYKNLFLINKGHGNWRRV